MAALLVKSLREMGWAIGPASPNRGAAKSEVRLGGIAQGPSARFVGEAFEGCRTIRRRGPGGAADHKPAGDGNLFALGMIPKGTKADAVSP